MEMKKILESLQECGMEMPAAAPMDRGTPVSMNISLNASGKDHVEDLISMMKNAGLGQAREVGPDMMPMRQDMERLRGIVDGPEMEEEEVDEWDNSPEGSEGDEQFGDLSDVLPSGDDLNKKKQMFAKAQDGDNAMAVEDIKAALYAALAEKSTGDYSAKKARAGKDIGKPGKNFDKIAKDAAKRYGSKERGEKVAGAVLAKLRKG